MFLVDEGLRQREAQAAAACAARYEGMEYALLQLGRHARPVVGDIDGQRVAVAAARQRHLAHDAAMKTAATYEEALQVLRARGARVLLVSRTGRRFDLARTLGVEATHVAGEGALETAARRFSGREGVDLVVETAGTSEAVAHALALVRPGVHPRDVHAAGMKPGLAAGLAEFSRFHCGHGIGISVYDPPLMTAMDPTRSIFLMPGVESGLETGMVINVEVGYYVQGVFGFLCEDTVLITENGCERLTHASKALAFGEFVGG